MAGRRKASGLPGVAGGGLILGRVVRAKAFALTAPGLLGFDHLRRWNGVQWKRRPVARFATRLRRSEVQCPRSVSAKVSVPPPIAVDRRLDFLVPISAKKLATRCNFVRQREKKDLRKLHGVARLRKARKKSGGFDSLHPLQP